jgi:hypothetical protein
MRGGASARTSVDVRCRCGKLVARWQGDDLVIKCTRCGRFVSIHHSAIQGIPPGDMSPGDRQ